MVFPKSDKVTQGRCSSGAVGDAWGHRPGRTLPATVIAASILLAACSDKQVTTGGETIRIGAVLPFTGTEAAMGRNLEQALYLAMEDVNEAGGINGIPIEIVSRDSNSGSKRGLDEILNLLYNDEITYLVGPEENTLAGQIVPDVKDLDVMNILPGYAAPSIQRSTTKGAWLRLAPTPWELSCGLGKHAIEEGVHSTNTLSTVDDFNTDFAGKFLAQFSTLGGIPLTQVGVQPGQDSYAKSIARTMSYGAERTLLNAYPATGSDIVAEWAITGHRGAWYLSPLLHTDVFLLNTPYGALDGAWGLSPSLSLASECETLIGVNEGAVRCKRNNAQKFIEHFAARWSGAQPFPAAHLYYDAVILLAMGLQYSLATSAALPPPGKLQQTIRKLSNSANPPAYWYDLKAVLANLADGNALRFVGAGAEYDFGQYGDARHNVFDTWTVQGQSFVEMGSYYAYCWQLR